MQIVREIVTRARPPQIARAALAVLLLFGLVQTEWSNRSQLSAESRVLLQWNDRAAQERFVLGDELYDMLTAADAMLPPRAPVLLVTDGADPRHREYFAFHRALYRLAPRPVWWVSPAVPDGTWESRWWIPSPLTAEALQTVARNKNISFMLFDDVAVPDGLGAPVVLTTHARLLSLQSQPTLAQPVPPASPNLFGALVGVLVIVALGRALVAIAMRLGHRAGRVEQWSLAWLLGAGACSILMLWLNALGLSLEAQLGVITLVSLGALFLIAIANRSVRNTPSFSPAAPNIIDKPVPHAAPLVLSLLIALQLAFVAVMAVGRPLTIWDSWVNWALKARIIFLAHGITPDLFGEPARTVTQLDYPLLVPLVEAWTFAWAGSPADWLTGIPAVLYFAALLGVGYGVCRAQMSGTRALLVAIVLAMLLPLSGLAAAVFTDLPLAALAAVAGAFALRWLETRARGTLLLAAFAAGLLPWTKREGAILLLALAVAILIVNRREHAAWLASGGMAMAALVCAAPWYVLMALSGVRNVAFAPFTLTTLQANLVRLPRIASLELPRLVSADWNFLWLAVALVALAARRTRARADLLPLAALLYFGAMSAAYVFSDFVPYQQHVVSSVDRLLAHVTPLVVLWVAYRSAVAHKLKHNSK